MTIIPAITPLIHPPPFLISGNLLILFGSHIGISEGGQLGRFTRNGQSADGAACGAACGALRHCLSGGVIPSVICLGIHPHDYQMQFIIHEISKVADLIGSKPTEDEQQTELALQMFYISKVLFVL